LEKAQGARHKAQGRSRIEEPKAKKGTRREGYLKSNAHPKAAFGTPSEVV